MDVGGLGKVLGGGTKVFVGITMGRGEALA